MAEAFFWGFIASSSLLIGAALTYPFNIKKRVLGLIMAFGVGVLISAVAYQLIQEAFDVGANNTVIALGLLAGALVFFAGDSLLDKFGGNHRKRSNGKQAEGSGVAILLGTILDGIPESLIIGLIIVKGGAVSIAMIIAVFLSNLPEAIAATTGLRASGWKGKGIFGLWALVVLISALSALAGYIVFETAHEGVHAFVLAFAGGAILTMLSDTMMPEAYEDSGKLVGLVTTLGFGLAFAISTIK